MEHDLRLRIFWIVHLILLGLFGIEMAFVLSAWLKARVPGLPADASRRRKLGAAAGSAVRLIFSRRMWVLMKALVVDGLVHRRLYRVSRRRWAVHASVFGAWLALGVLSIVTGVVVEILPLLGMSPEAVATLPFLGHLFHADVWWVALLNELLGLVALGGMALVIYRRYVQKDSQLRTIPADNAVIGLLTLIVLTGFPTEAFRLLADYTTAAGVFAPDPTMLPLERFPLELHDAWGPQWGFAGYLSALILGTLRLSADAWSALHNVFFWLHFLIVTALLFYLPFSRFFHVIMSPVIVAYNTMLEQEAGGEAIVPEAERSGRREARGEGPGKSDRQVNPAHFTLRQMMELEACTRCGECIETCPTFAETRNEEIHPLDKIARIKRFWKADHLGWLARLFGIRPAREEELATYSQGVYRCTLCARCHVVCPVQIETRSLWLAMRQQLVAWGLYPEVFDTLRERVMNQYNIVGDDNTNRLIWTQNMERVPEGLDRVEGVETVYFMGCVGAMYPRVYGVPQSFVQILQRVGESFTTLGSEEWCCGFPLEIAGMGQQVHALARHNVEAIRAIGARRLVTTCPSCYHTWAHAYPRLLGGPLGFQVLHATELLADLIDEGTLRLYGFPQPVTYHDPCDLGRTSGIYDAPRRIIQAIPGMRFTEMADNREMSLCCGGGGDAEMADAALTAAVGKRRIQQAQETGAEVVISACQQCSRTLAEAARRNRIRMRVLDIVEVVWEAMQEGRG